jgi:elongation factor Tu
MITGATQMEGAILVVSVIDGPQVQTREHIILAKEIGIPYIVVFLNKLDNLKEKEMIELVEFEVRELLENYSYPIDLPVLKGSAKKALEENIKTATDLGFKSVEELMNVVDDYVKEPIRLIDEPFLMPVENSISIRGRGTVITGKIEKGKIEVNDELELIGKVIYKTICMGLETFKKSLDFAQVGDNVGILLKNIERKSINKGFIAATPQTIFAHNFFKARVYIISKEEGGRHKPFFNNYKPQFFFRTSNITGTITFDQEMALPGDSLVINVELINKVALNVGLRFVMREGNLTIGAGVIIEIIS